MEPYSQREQRVDGRSVDFVTTIERETIPRVEAYLFSAIGRTRGSIQLVRVRRLVQLYPVRALAVALALGFVLGFAIKRTILSAD